MGLENLPLGVSFVVVRDGVDKHSSCGGRWIGNYCTVEVVPGVTKLNITLRGVNKEHSIVTIFAVIGDALFLLHQPKAENVWDAFWVVIHHKQPKVHLLLGNLGAGIAMDTDGVVGHLDVCEEVGVAELVMGATAVKEDEIAIEAAPPWKKIASLASWPSL